MAWDPDTWDIEFVQAVAETLAAEGVARWVPTGAYAVAGDLPAVYVATMPAAGSAVPVRAISLTPYLIEDTADEHTVKGLQVRCRGGANPVEALGFDSRVWRVLHRPLGLTLGTTVPQWCPSSYRRSSVAGVALDPTGKAREAVSNYALLLPRASVAPWS